MVMFSSGIKMRWATLSRRAKATAAVVSLVAAGTFAVGFVAASPAAAALLPTPAPISEPGANVMTADALPTAQINGVVWSQAIVGNTVYAGGSFTKARPAGVAAGGAGEVTRSNLMSYDITTGVMTSFAPTLNAQAKVIAKSPDGSRIYVGGQFTTVNGLNRFRIAAFDTATGALITSFVPQLDYIVNAIVATNTTVYVGGSFSKNGTTPRSRLAAFAASNGALLAWAPSADDNVNAMVMAPSGSKIIVGGSFQHINGAAAYGLGALDPTTGALLPWAAGTKVRDAGVNAAINSLSTDGTSIFGTGYVFGAGGNLEGTFSAEPETGNINWIEDCHGDTYGAYSANGVVYTVSHSHFCGNVGAFPQTEPVWTDHRALAWTADAVGTVAHNSTGNYFDWFGNPAPSQYNWYPDLTAGTFTGQGQAAWDLTGNGTYMVMGGEFTSVNFNGGQQGLVRFALKPPSPGKQGPRLSGASYVPTLLATSSHTVRVNWAANWDRDSENLTYKVIRNDLATAPVYTTSATSQFWNLPSMGYVDSGLTPGATYTYKIYAVDNAGNSTQGGNVSITLPLTDPSPYVTQALNDGPSNYWRLGEASGTTGTDSAGTNNLVEGNGVGHGATGAIVGDTNKASTFSGTSTGTAGTTSSLAGPNTFSLEAWFNTTTTRGGKIIGFGSSRSGNSSNYDRHVYMDNAGHIYFGVYPGAAKTVHSSGTYRNGQWHHIVATLSSAGMVLYVDGVNVGSDPTVTFGQAYTGYWRVGGDTIGSWPAAPTSANFAGTIDEAAVYPTALTQAQVTGHFTAASGVTNQLPVPAFTPTCTDLNCSFDASASVDPDGSLTSYAWNFGDTTTGTGVTASRAYATGGTYQVTLTVTDNKGGTSSVTHPVTILAANQLPTAAFTQTCTDLVCSFNGTTSSDPDGSIPSSGYAWDFGDTTTGTGSTKSHTFATGGTYQVALTVTDNRGGTNTVTQPVTVLAANQSPTAAFGQTCDHLACSFDGSGSVDPDGSITGYAWDFGDVTTANTATPDHTFANNGTYQVTLTVTDNRGGTNSVVHPVTVSSGNQAPVAAFTPTCTLLQCSFDTTASTDPDGSVTGYAWDFGDSSTGTGANATHDYATGGTYPVTLTVTDNEGGTNQVVHSVTVATTAVLAADLFARSTTNAWGTADTGGGWTVAGIPAANFSVSAGLGRMAITAVGTTPTAYLNSTPVSDSDSVVDFTFDKAQTGSSYTYAYIAARHVGTSQYRLRTKILGTGVIQLSITKVVANVETVLLTKTMTGLTFTPSQFLRMRLRISGTSSVALSGKLWAVGSNEPAAWDVTTSDANSPLGAGASGVTAYLASASTNTPVVAQFANFNVTTVAGP
jgi:trimeric autotransporter adhesin